MNATPKTATSNPNSPPISNRNPNQPTPHVTPTKQTKALIISNRESLRLEINVTPTKQRPDPDSNRELEPLFTAPAITTRNRNAAIQITTIGGTAQKKAPRHLPRGFEIATGTAERPLTAAAWLLGQPAWEMPDAAQQRPSLDTPDRIAARYLA